MQPSPSPAASAAGNRLAAVHEAERLLALAPRPAGSVRIQPTAAQRAGLFGSEPAVASLVDRSVYVSVAMRLDAATTWLDAHRPANLRATGRGTASRYGRTTGHSLTWTAPAGPAWSSSELDVADAPLGTSRTIWQFEAQVVWLDPRPQRDDAAGPRLRVPATGPCPASDRKAVGVTNPGSAVTTRLLPAGTPSTALVCDYAGLNGSPAFGLVRTVHLDRSAAAHLAAIVDRIRLAHPDGSEVSCPMDDSSTTVIAFAFPGQADVDLWYHSRGCAFVANGHIAAEASLPVR